MSRMRPLSIAGRAPCRPELYPPMPVPWYGQRHLILDLVEDICSGSSVPASTHFVSRLMVATLSAQALAVEMACFFSQTNNQEEGIPLPRSAARLIFVAAFARSLAEHIVAIVDAIEDDRRGAVPERRWKWGIRIEARIANGRRSLISIERVRRIV